MSTAISATPVMSPSGSWEGNQENAQCRNCWLPADGLAAPGAPVPAAGTAGPAAAGSWPSWPSLAGAAAPSGAGTGNVTAWSDSSSGWSSASTWRTADSARPASGPGQISDGVRPMCSDWSIPCHRARVWFTRRNRRSEPKKANAIGASRSSVASRAESDTSIPDTRGPGTDVPVLMCSTPAPSVRVP